MPCPDKIAVRAYLTPEEHALVKRLARGSGLSISRLLREIVLTGQVKSFELEEFKLELLKTRAELGRLGGLLKLALTMTPEVTGLAPENCRELLVKIGQGQNELREAVKRL